MYVVVSRLLISGDHEPVNLSNEETGRLNSDPEHMGGITSKVGVLGGPTVTVNV